MRDVWRTMMAIEEKTIPRMRISIPGRVMNREEALGIVREYVKNENLINHMLAVEAAMRAYARKYGADEDEWGVVGLLHDFDWEIHPTLDEHPTAGAPTPRSCRNASNFMTCSPWTNRRAPCPGTTTSAATRLSQARP